MTARQSILAVDDRPENLLALERTLEEIDAQLVRATSGEQALACTLNQRFDLAILDVRMPGMDGYELASLLRGDPATREIPIIFLTAASGQRDQIFRGYESGAADYIVKPFAPEILLCKVRILLEMRAQSEALRRQRAELELVNGELEAFAYSVSHDLRAPLRAIRGFSEALLEDCLPRLQPQEQDYLQRVCAEAQHMGQLIDAMLSLSRVSRAELRPQPVDLSALARELLDNLRQRDPQRQVEIQVEQGLSARGDPTLLRQALENLLENAWKYTAGREPATIAVQRVPTEGAPAFVVRDNGAGFDMQYADRIFAPFRRLHSAEQFPGTGVGLSTVQRIVVRHGGRIWCEASPDGGAAFYFTLNQPEESEP